MNSTARNNVIFFKDLDKKDVGLVGGKAANLGEMIKAGFRVPDGFAVTVYAYDQFLKENNLDKAIYRILDSTDVNDPVNLSQSAQQIQRLIKKGEISNEIKLDIAKAYKKLSGFMQNTLVAARSSATAEDMPGTSFAGQQVTLLNIKGDANLLNAVRECWASLFTPRSIFYRVQHSINHKKVMISVAVQKMIQSDVSGVMFSIDPVTNEKDRIVIEAVWGLGELIVQGTVVPDRYVVQKETYDILSKEIAEQKIQLIKKGSETKELPVLIKNQHRQKITNEEIVVLAKYADRLQKHYYFPQDIEWARDKKGIYIIQTRPITTIKAPKPLSKTNFNNKETKEAFATSPILVGTPASPGIGSGRAKILKSAKEIGKVSHGDILVAPMTSPDFVPAMKKASAIITDEGGVTSHAAIVSRELGIPCVVGTKSATGTLKEDWVVTVDGEKGQVFMGGRIKVVTKKKIKEKIFSAKTATKLYVNLAEPERVKEIAKLPVDGIGLLRAEFMMANIGLHPKEAIKQKKQGDYIDKLYQGIKAFCKAFYPRPVIYRASDFKTNEYRSLEGGNRWEPQEPNPMLGFRGAFRYIANQEVFTLELKALKKVLEEYNNLNMMVPFVRSPQELKRVRQITASEGLFNHTAFKFLMMVELPVNVIMLEDFAKVGIDGISIGSNDLTMLLTGTDRDNAEVASAFNEQSDVVLWALRKTIKTANKLGITSSICGQAPSIYDDLVKKLVSWQITSISVNPDSISRARNLIYEAEKEILK